MRRGGVLSKASLSCIFMLILIVVVPSSYDDYAVDITPIGIAKTASSNLTVTVTTLNIFQAFNDDDVRFEVVNNSVLIAGAIVTLLHSGNLSMYTSSMTDGMGSTIFYNVPQGDYVWNVTVIPQGVFETGIWTSDGPEATLEDIRVNNLDYDNDDDDFRASAEDISGNPAGNLNVTILHLVNESLWGQTISGTDGTVRFDDLPPGQYKWSLSLPFGVYQGWLLDEGNFTTDGTEIIMLQTVAPIGGDPQIYDVEVFVHYEESHDPIVNALVEFVYHNGSFITQKSTNSEGIALYLDLPIAFVNWTVTYDAEILGESWFNFSAPAYDIRDPIIEGPPDQEFEVNSSPKLVNWTLRDEYPRVFSLIINGVLNLTIDWENKTREFTYDLDWLDVGFYELEILAFDINYNLGQDIVHVRIYETEPPVIMGPDDIELYFGESGHTITWNINEVYFDSYTVLLDGEIEREGFLEIWNQSIQVVVDDLTLGTHNFTLLVNDTSGNFATDSVNVTIIPDTETPLIFYTPPTVYYRPDETNILRNWTVTDDTMKNYSINVDGIQVITADWNSSNIFFDFGGLAEGAHLVVLTVQDYGNNTAVAEVTVFVDGTQPLLTHPDDITYTLGATGHSIFWEASDLTPYYYEISLNESILDSGHVWPTSFEISVDGLEVGTYEYSIFVSDIVGHNSTDVVIVTVVDVTMSSVSTTTDTTSPSTGSQQTDGSLIILVTLGGGILALSVIIVLMKKK